MSRRKRGTFAPALKPLHGDDSARGARHEMRRWAGARVALDEVVPANGPAAAATWCRIVAAPPGGPVAGGGPPVMLEEPLADVTELIDLTDTGDARTVGQDGAALPASPPVGAPIPSMPAPMAS